MPPLALTNSQLDAVMTTAAPLSPDQRGPFLLAVAERLRGVPIGDGSVARVCRELQREFFDPPQLVTQVWGHRGKPKAPRDSARRA